MTATTVMAVMRSALQVPAKKDFRNFPALFTPKEQLDTCSLTGGILTAFTF